MKPVNRAAAACLLAATTATAQDVRQSDDDRRHWRHRHDVTVETDSGFAQLVLPPELGVDALPDLRDVRLVAADGREVPYLVDRVIERDWGVVHEGLLLDRRSVPLGGSRSRRSRSAWVVDLGETRRFDTIFLDVDGSGFSKHFRVAASVDRAAWAELARDAPVFEGEWAGRIRHTTIDLGDVAAARYVQLETLDDRLSPRVAITRVSVSLTRRNEGQEWSRAAALEPIASSAPARYSIDVPEGFPLDVVTLEADDPGFARQVRVLELSEQSGAPRERVLASGRLYRLDVPEEALAVDSRALRLSTAPERGRLLLEVAGSPPLHNPRITASGATRRLVFAAQPVTLYYGNDATRAPLYDLEHLRWRLRLSADLTAATIGDSLVNPRYVAPEPFAFAPAFGAAVEAPRWRSTKAVVVDGDPDVFSVRLDPEDVAALRDDLADLRLIDVESRQVPFLIETGAARERLPLEFEDDGSARSDDGWNRHPLRAKSRHDGEPVTLPVESLEFHLPDAFFERPARVLAPERDGRRGERRLHTGTLRRRPDSGADDDARGAVDSEPAPVMVPLGGARVSSLTLEIDDGDNAPLSFERVDAVVAVPRVIFKAGPGAYRMLLGNRAANAPRYDLATLRRELIAYSAVPVDASALAPNAAFRRSLGEEFKSAPPTLVMWVVLIAGVVALLALVARVVREPSPPSAGDGPSNGRPLAGILDHSMTVISFTNFSSTLASAET